MIDRPLVFYRHPNHSINLGIEVFDYSINERYNPPCLKEIHKNEQEEFVANYLFISLIITSIALILAVILQSKGAGLGGLTGADTGGVFTARRGIEKTLFRVTIVISFIFFALCIATVMAVPVV